MSARPCASASAAARAGGRPPARAARPGPTAQPGEKTSVRAVLLSGLHPGQQDAVDNVGAPQPDRIRALVEAAGDKPVFLPAHSPDLSPIEEAFSRLKALIRAAAARTRAALDAAIAAALEATTPADAAGWFSHAGYLTRQAA